MEKKKKKPKPPCQALDRHMTLHAKCLQVTELHFSPLPGPSCSQACSAKFWKRLWQRLRVHTGIHTPLFLLGIRRNYTSQPALQLREAWWLAQSNVSKRETTHRSPEHPLRATYSLAPSAGCTKRVPTALAECRLRMKSRVHYVKCLGLFVAASNSETAVTSVSFPILESLPSLHFPLELQALQLLPFSFWPIQVTNRA